MGRVGIWLGTGIAGVVALWLLLAYGSANVDRVLTAGMAAHVDFETFHRSAVASLHGQSIYDTGAKVVNLNPPVWTVLVTPLGWLDLLVAYRVFSVLSALAVLGSAVLVARELGLSRRATILASVAILLSSPLLGTIALGQVYGVLLAGLTAAWLAARRGHPVASGVFLGLVIAIKPTLAPLLLWPIACRCWPALRAAVAGMAGATAIGFAVAGPSATARWFGVLRSEHLSTFGDNASLPAFVARLGGPAWLGILLGTALVAVTYRRSARGRGGGTVSGKDTVDADLSLWALTAATLLVSPVAWHNYLVLCFPGVLVLLRRGRVAVGAFLLTLPLIGVEWGIHLWHGTGPLDRIGASLYCFVLLAYWAALLPRPTGGAGPRDPGRDADQRAQGSGFPGNTSAAAI